MIKLNCCGKENCLNEIKYIDKKGFIYCENHGKLRKQYVSARKLTKKELQALTQGLQLNKY